MGMGVQAGTGDATLFAFCCDAAFCRQNQMSTCKKYQAHLRIPKMPVDPECKVSADQHGLASEDVVTSSKPDPTAQIRLGVSCVHVGMLSPRMLLAGTCILQALYIVFQLLDRCSHCVARHFCCLHGRSWHQHGSFSSGNRDVPGQKLNISLNIFFLTKPDDHDMGTYECHAGLNTVIPG